MAVLAPRHFSADGGDGGQREQRIAPRVHCDIPLALTLYGNESESRIRDISASGAAVDSTEQVELGEVFYLRFALPGVQFCNTN